MALKDLEDLKEEEFDDSFIRKKELLHYLYKGDILRSSNGEYDIEFRVLSVGPKKVFVYGVFNNGEKESKKRISIDRLAREYDEVARFRKIIPKELR